MATIPLTTPSPTQAHVIGLPIDMRVIVIAGPGAGKTFTLLERAEAIRSLADVGTGRVLVLSFTRAVVDELRKRDRARGAATPILVETFDSFASRMLREYASDETWQRESFDGRIEACTNLIASGTLDDYLEELQHVFLDEVQDLVGPRARLIRELLGTYPGGFTAFGDPAQAIYDYADDSNGEDDILSSPVGLQLADDEVILEGNYRMADPARAARTAALHRSLLDDPLAAAIELASEIASLPIADENALAHDGPETTAILCRSNVMALTISRRLWERGHAHRVRRSSVDRPVAG